MEGDVLSLSGGELAGGLVFSQGFCGVGQFDSRLIGKLGDAGIVGDVERGDAVEVFLQLGKRAFAIFAVHNRAIVGKGFRCFADKADEVIKDAAAYCLGGAGSRCAFRCWILF